MQPYMAAHIGTLVAPQVQARQAQQASYMANLGKFFMYAGTGMAQGIGQGLANTDLRNPFKGAGMSLLGGSALGQAAAGQQMSIESEQTKSAMRLDEYQRKLEADLETEKEMLKTFKPMPRRRAEQQEEMEDRGEMKIGTSYLSPAGKVFLAQQGLATAEAARLLSGVRSGVRGMA